MQKTWIQNYQFFGSISWNFNRKVQKSHLDKIIPSLRAICSTYLHRCKLAQKYLTLIIVICAAFAASCDGATITAPEHFAAEAGSTKNLTCVSDITDYEVYWLWSAGRQRSVTEIYDGAVPESKKDKFKVSENIAKESQRIVKRSTFIIQNISLADGGTIYCRDDGGFGALHPIRIYVFEFIPKIKCNCKGDIVNVTLSYCYWGEKSLSVKWNLSLSDSDWKNETKTEKYNEAGRCIQYTSMVQLHKSHHLEASADLVDESSSNIVVSYNLTNEEYHSQIKPTESSIPSLKYTTTLTTPTSQYEYQSNGQIGQHINAKHLTYVSGFILYAYYRMCMNR